LLDLFKLTELQGRGNPMIGFEFNAVKSALDTSQDVWDSRRGEFCAHEFDMPGTDVG